jgi:hypothetical protein
MMENAHEPGQEYETLGRVLRCMFDLGATLRTPTARAFHFWRRLEGGYAMEWTGGPHAVEVLAELEALAADDEVTGALSPGDITEAEEYSPGAVSFRVRGVLFQLRPVDTIGVEADREQVLSRLA